MSRVEIPETLRLLLKHRSGMIGLLILGSILLIAIFADFVAPYNPYERVDTPYLKPSAKHILGTNDVGQDIFSEVVYGARVSLLIGFAAGASVVAVGTILGLLSGFVGGWVDEIIMRVADVILIMPNLLLMIFLCVILRTRSFWVIVFAITINSWPGVARLIRSAVLTIKERAFVKAAMAAGGSTIYIMFKHILPNVAPLLFASMITRAGSAMLSEASLSFLGLGDPTIKSWGQILHFAQTAGGWWCNDGKPAWWWIFPPGLLIAVTALGVFLVGQAIEEIVNPRLRKR